VDNAVRKDIQKEPKTVMLAANENPEPVPLEIREGVRAGALHVNRYTFESEARVFKKLAKYYQCSQGNWMLVRGIDEAFDRVSHEFPQMRYATAWPGFDGYSNRIRVHRYQHFQIRLTPDFALDTADLGKLSAYDFVFLADPSNPTGRPLSSEEHKAIRERSGKVFMDETYADYAGRDDGCPTFDENLFVFRSFSKSFGLAGSRLGVVFGPEDLIQTMKSKQWYCNVGVLDLFALEAAIENDFLRKAHIEKTVAERERINKMAERLRFCVYPSAGNFILIRDDETNSIERFLLDRGIVVRNTARFGLLDHIRISVGLPPENDRLLEALAHYTAARKDLNVR
jgi:histidinol-phosphate/aromatic aminotransferase/cobyric acid decarboxylase-like protein